MELYERFNYLVDYPYGPLGPQKYEFKDPFMVKRIKGWKKSESGMFIKERNNVA
jgi:hypothetical protein